MRILGIETSCDETSVSIVEDGRKVLSNLVASQQKLHSRYFGVVPELASRAHLEKINYLFGRSLNSAENKTPVKESRQLGNYIKDNIDAVAYTYGPGLMGSLLVGQVAAQSLAFLYNKPLIKVNHLEGHISSVFLKFKGLKPPLLSLIVSGGHTELILVKGYCSYKLVGATRDDACGEAYDKVARILGLSYPGGPVIEKLAKKAKGPSIDFPRPFMRETWDFSFSGLKTAVVNYVNSKKKSGEIDKKLINNVCMSFQDAVIETLIEKTIRASRAFKINKLTVSGGVASNNALRSAFRKCCRKNGIEVYFPDIKMCTDNAAMIASAGYYRYKRGDYGSYKEAEVDSNAILG